MWWYLAGSLVGYIGFFVYLAYRFPDKEVTDKDRMYGAINSIFSWLGVIGLIGAIAIFEWNHRDEY